MSLQALMPPWAQTLWLRFTGTIENRSTSTPSSASLMVQANPANPPPTTITRFFEGKAMMNPRQNAERRMQNAELKSRAGPIFRSAFCILRSALPHQLPKLLPLLVDELQVVLQV